MINVFRRAGCPQPAIVNRCLLLKTAGHPRVASLAALPQFTF